MLGLAMGLLFILFDMIVGMATSPIMARYADLPIWQTPLNITAGLIFDIINGFILVFVFNLITPSLPGQGWRKGLWFGLIVWLLRVVMMAFSTIVMYNVPLAIVMTNLIAGLIEVEALSIILAAMHKKLK